MVSLLYTTERGWFDARVMPYGPIELDPSAIVPALRAGDLRGTQGLPVDRRCNRVVPPRRQRRPITCLGPSAGDSGVPDELFLESLRQLIAVDHEWVPLAGGEQSLYLRPFIIATEPGLGVRPSAEYRYLLIASPAGAYFRAASSPSACGCPPSTCEPARRNRCGEVRRQLRRVVAGPVRSRRSRLRPGGVAGRHRTALCRGDGRDEPVLRLRKRRIGATGHPELSGSLLPGITRDSLLQLAGDAGFAVEERKIDVEEWRKGWLPGRSPGLRLRNRGGDHPVAQVKYGEGEFTVGDGEPGEVTMALRDTSPESARAPSPTPTAG